MSFTAEVKRELCLNLPKSGCCQNSFFAGLCAINGTWRGSKSDMSFTFTTENRATGEMFEKLLNTLFVISAEYTYKNKLYSYKISDAETFLRELEIMGENDIHFTVQKNLADCCKRAFISGAFIGGGSITSPEKRYHLEFVTPHYHLSRDICDIFESFDIPAKCVVRKSKYVIYFKDNEIIGDVLALMGAKNALWDLNNANIIKSIKNRENRISNCESANIGRTVDASVLQRRAIEYISEHYGLENLPPQLLGAARLRMENPDLSLSEIAQLANPPMSKSGINHRMRKLVLFAKELKESK